MSKKLTKKEINGNYQTVTFSWNGTKYKEKIENLKLSSITLLELKEALNVVPAKYAFWSSIYSDVNKQIDQLKSDFDLWLAEQQAVALPDKPKASETAKKNSVYLDNPAEVRKYHDTLNRLNAVKGKVKSMVGAYDMQSRTLQTIAAIMRQEFAVLKTGGGSGSLLDD